MGNVLDKNILTKEEILHFLRKNRDYLKKEFDVDEIMLFGSYARDEAGPESDIDILIKSKTKKFNKWYKLKIFLEKNLKKDVDVVYTDAMHPFIMRFVKEEIIYA
ncbi:nucleotidyltransferase family protein [Candidatus Dependentiae bacterium]